MTVALVRPESRPRPTRTAGWLGVVVVTTVELVRGTQRVQADTEAVVVHARGLLVTLEVPPCRGCPSGASVARVSPTDLEPIRVAVPSPRGATLPRLPTCRAAWPDLPWED